MWQALVDATEEPKRLAALMRNAEASLKAELAAREQWAPAACFPAPLIIEGTHQLIDHWLAEVESLRDTLHQVSEWEKQSSVLKRAIDGVERKAELKQRLRAASQRL
eukprot:EG_transcript_62625